MPPEYTASCCVRRRRRIQNRRKTAAEMASVKQTTMATIPCVGNRSSGDEIMELSLVAVMRAEGATVAPVQSEDTPGMEVPDETSPDGVGLCQLVAILVTGGAVLEDVAEAPPTRVAVCVCCAEAHSVHWYVDEGHPGSTRSAMP